MLTSRGLGRLVEPLTGRALEGREVFTRAVARAAALARYELAQGDRVFLHHGNSIDFFVDLLAVWRLGGCAIPVDSRLVSTEIATLAAAARPTLSMWDGSAPTATLDVLHDADVRVIDAKEEAAAPAQHDAPGASFRLDDEALILFTSGTTGDPKGVVHTHRSLRARWMGLYDALGINAFRRTLCLLPTHFGHGLICNCLFPWFFGQDVYILPPFRADLIVRLGELIDTHDITCLSSVPTVWRLALKIAKPPQRGTLQRVLCGSAPLTGSLWRSIQGWTGTREVINAYGITETGSWLAGMTSSDVEPGDGLIGEAWGGTLAVLPTHETDPQPDFQAACKPHEPGFIWVNTPALMKGYLDRDDLTSRVVVNGWFSTGDLGIVDEHGRLHLRGRVREEINKSGQKIYPTDIDTVIEQFEHTLDVCAFAVPDALHGEDVGVAVVLETPSDDAMLRLQEWTRGRLGVHQMPARWYMVNAIPRTSRGKVNRQQVAEYCASLSPVSPATPRRESSQ
jgi:acyl-CoA synthetase (AMP-forming)/AMP-acid ligase II